VEEKKWKAVWSIQAPGKMKIVLWRMIHDCLPTGHQLTRRHIPADDRCVFCGQHERVEHLFLFCPFARAVWSEVKASFPLRLRRKELINSRQWIFDFLHRESDLNATVLVVTCWHIWDARNELRNNGVHLSPLRVASKILAYVEMISTYLCKPAKPVKNRIGQLSERWTPPPPGWICINVDAALFPNDLRMGCGVVLRDHHGGFILSASEGLNCFPAPELAEALAARWALTLARNHGVKKAVLISDCLSLIQRIVSPRRDRSSLGAVIRDIKTLVADFESCIVKFASRNLNVVAHKLARSAEPSFCNISVSVIPELIRDELCNDVG
jgi:hypothetical protein